MSSDILPEPMLVDVASIALFLDVDGTMVEFADRPGAVCVDPQLPGLLAHLHGQLGGALAPVSGRSLDEIDGLLQWGTRSAAGLHGGELRHPDGRVDALTVELDHDEALREWAANVAIDHPAVFIERKRNALALHYRDAPDGAQALAADANRFIAGVGNYFELQPGHCVIEIKPRGASKATAVRALMAQQPFAGRTPWVLGDDLTDEFAFQAAQSLAGVAVIVGGRRPTLATAALADPRAVREWLAALSRRLDETVRGVDGASKRARESGSPSR